MSTEGANGLPSLLLLAVALGSCLSATPLARADDPLGKLGMVAILGTSPEVPGIGMTTFLICFSDAAQLVQLRGTADDGPLYGSPGFKVVSDVLAAHNVSIRDEIMENHLTKCEAGEDWDDASGRINESIAQGGAGASAPKVAIIGRGARRGQVVVEGVGLSGSRQVVDRVCSALQSSGISRQVPVEIIALDSIGLPETREAWGCRDGAAARSGGEPPL